MEKAENADFWTQAPEKQLEQLRRFGEQYRHLIDNALGSRKDPLSGKSDPAIKKIERGVSAFSSEQMQRQAAKNLDAAGFLQQSFTSEEHQKLIHENPDKFRLEALSPGVYAVHLNPTFMRQLRPGASAVAVKMREGVSYLMLQDWSVTDDESAKAFEAYRTENIPHETHHLIWGSIVNQGGFPSKESDDDFAKTFQLFRDELIARALSDGSLGGYSHITYLQPEARQELEQTYPGKADAILKKVTELNGLLEDLNTTIRNSTRISKKDLVKVAVEATTLDDLREVLEKVKILCEHFPKKDKPPETSSGWGSIPT
jgi:hypothetical protein